MPDREKVIKGLECLARKQEPTANPCKGCGYNDKAIFAVCVFEVAFDALALLKEQEEEIENLKQTAQSMMEGVCLLKEHEADTSKYQYKYDHTDCIWYHSDEESRCPSSCSQYRDGWNDAMDYIFKDGKGYQPYIRKEGRRSK